MSNIDKLFFAKKEGMSWPWIDSKDLDGVVDGHTMPKITIITPSFNQGNYLEATIRSVLLQNYPNLEYIIIDGGSTDNSVEIIEKYAPYLTYWISEKDSGQSEAINKGLKVATGDIINWLNSDDYYAPGALLKVAETFQESQALVVTGRSFLFKGENEVVKESTGTDVYSGNLPKTIGWARIDQPETFFRKEAIEAMGPLDTRLHYLMDRDWWMKFLFRFGIDQVKKIPDLLVHFRLHDLSKTVSQAEAFQVEHDTYFYSLAKKTSQLAIANLIKESTNVKLDFETTLVSPEPNLAEQALHYYLLLRANEFYASNEKQKAKVFLTAINPAFLKKEDQKTLRKLKFRNSFIPLWALNKLRKS
jgi:glycosyltransferase involved in cell wall biosynthesis